MADTTDLKSVASNSVRVRVPPAAPTFKNDDRRTRKKNRQMQVANVQGINTVFA